MSDLGSSAAVGIESVEWVDAGAGNLTVRVTGRWRRRRGWGRAEARAPAALVVEADGRRHRFPATPEPPSLANVAPGHWRLSFSLPAELASQLGPHAQLTLGTVTVPLPVPESATRGASPPGPDTGRAPRASPPPAPFREPAPAPSPAPAPAGDAVIGPETGQAPGEPSFVELPRKPLPIELPGGPPDPSATAPEPPGALAPGEPAAEPAGRAPDAAGPAPPPDDAGLEIERAWRRADDAERRADAAQQRMGALEASLAQARRAQEDAAAAAAAAVSAAEAARELADRRTVAPGGAPAAEAARLDAEAALRSARRSDAPPRVPAEPPAAVAGRHGPPRQGGAGLPEPDLVAALRRELGARVSAEAGLRARLVQAETRLAARVLLEQRTTATLRDLRGELDRLGESLGREREARRAAEAETARIRAELGGRRERSLDVIEAIGEIRGALEGLRTPAEGAEGAAVPDPAGAVEPERLGDALARLRATQQPRDDAAPGPSPDAPPGGASMPVASTPVAASPAAAASTAAAARPPGAPTLEVALRRLLRSDADQAGRLLLGVLGAQRAAYPHPVAYDLVLGPGRGCVQVTVGEGDPEIVISGAARAREQVAFQVVGDPARIARLLLAGPLRRRLRFGVARVRGDRAGFAALRALRTLPLGLLDLSRDGMRAEPGTLLALVAGMLDPAWTRGERFTIACRDEAGRAAWLQIRDGRAPLVTPTAPEGRVSASLSGSEVQLTRALAGAPSAAQVGGDPGALAVLREWIDRAQCG